MTKECIKIGIAGKKGQTANYERSCIELGLCPFTSLSLSTLSTCDALILPGGSDITPGFYGQENHGSRGINTELDLLQIQALEYFIRAKKPVLGICKGMQLINVYFGGTLIQDLPNHKEHQQEEGDLLHSSYATEDCILSRLYDKEFTINSNHHQAIDKLGRHLHVIQYSHDHVIEGIVHDTLPIVAVQWHPERLPLIQTKKASLPGNLLLRAFLTDSMA